jgi:hypothetical protein
MNIQLFFQNKEHSSSLYINGYLAEYLLILVGPPITACDAGAAHKGQAVRYVG